MYRIGDIKVPNRIALAPMASVSNGEIRRRVNGCETRGESLHILYEYAHESEAASKAA